MGSATKSSVFSLSGFGALGITNMNVKWWRKMEIERDPERTIQIQTDRKQD